jgi:hypothetical protein
MFHRKQRSDFRRICPEPLRDVNPLDCFMSLRVFFKSPLESFHQSGRIGLSENVFLK